MEGNKAYLGTVDVVVTDGFTGNVLIKTVEGLIDLIALSSNQALTKGGDGSSTGNSLGPAWRSISRNLDYSERGGAPLLGIKGNVIIAHGKSDAKTIKNAIILAHRVAAHGATRTLHESFTAPKSSVSASKYQV